MAKAYGFDSAGVDRIRRAVHAVEGAVPRLETGRNHRDGGGRGLLFGVLTTGASGASGAAGFTPATLSAFGEATIAPGAPEYAVVVPRLQ